MQIVASCFLIKVILACARLNNACMWLQVIMRHGRWQFSTAMFQSYLMFFKIEGLLASGNWPGAAEKDFGMFFAPRFCVEVSPSLIACVFPWFETFRQAVAELGRDAQPSHLTLVKVIPYLATVLVQDSLELAASERYAEDPVHKYLRADEEFRSAVMFKGVSFVFAKCA